MGTLHIYNSISNEHQSITGTGRLRDILPPEYDLANCAVIKAGDRIKAENYEVTQDDVLYIRVCPGAAVAAAVGIVIAVVAVGVGIYVGYKANQLAQEAEEKARQAEKNAKKLGEAVTQYPFLKGASNANALGSTIQFLLGNCYNSPYKLNGGFYSIGGTNGEKQYYNLILSAGWGKQLIQSLSVGNEKIKTFSDSEPQELVTAFDPDSLYYDDENVIEIAQAHEFETPYFGQKVIGEYYGDEIEHKHGESLVPLIKQCADNTMKVEVCIQFNGLRVFSDDEWRSKSVTVNPYWSNDGGTTWHQFTFNSGSNTFTFNSNHTLRFTATKTFNFAQAYGKNISIKLERETAKADSNSQENVYLLYVNSFCYDNKKSRGGSLVRCRPLESPFMEKTTRIGLRIIANANTSGMLDKINAVSYGVARTWNKVLRTWSEAKTPTRNIASWILEIMESETHLPSQMTDNELDLYSFGALYEYCDENHFYCDGIITQGIKKSDLVSKLLSLCFADMYIDSDGKYAIAIDKKETTPVALLNAQSVRSITAAKSLTRQPDGIKASFTNRESWLQDTRYVMLDGGEKGLDDVCGETTIEYATEADHVYKICQRRMRQQVLQPREVVVKVGHEGDYYPLYAKILLQLEQLRQGIRSAVIHRVLQNENGETVALDISDMVDFGGDGGDIEQYCDENGVQYCDENGLPYISINRPSTATYGIIIQAQDTTGKRHINIKVYGSGKTRRLYFMEPLADDGGIMPQPGNILSFGLLNGAGQFDRITNEMKITAVKPDADGWTLTLKDYSEVIYEYGVIPEYKSNLTSPVIQKLPGSIIGDEEYNAKLEALASISDSAIAKADNAQTAADGAQATADSAQTAAANARTAADNAQTAAANARTAADNAQTAAANARTAADNAQATADDAQATADDARARANAAQDAADDARARANAAQDAADGAQATADDAMQLISNITDDGIISGGTEKAQLYVQWMEAVADYSKYKAMADFYYDYTDEAGDNYMDEEGNSYVIASYLNPLTSAYTALAQTLNDNVSPTAAILDGSARPAWLAVNAMDTDTSISDISAYQNAWSAFYSARATLLNQITVDSKAAADDAQAIADNARTAANNAQTAADDAQTTADDARARANAAQNAADDARARANAAQNAADNAQTAADGAQDTADEAIDLSVTRLELSRSTLQFHLNAGDSTLYAETATFTAALMQDSEGLEADTVSVSVDSNAFTASASKNGLVITVSVSSVYGATFLGASITLTTTYHGLTFSAKCTLNASDTGKYLGSINSIANLPANPGFGDFITWTAANTTSNLVTDGTFKKTYVYRYTGTHGSTQKWIEDNRVEHNADALSDILSMNTESAAATNSYALTFLNRLVANNIFTDTLSAKNAFVENIKAKIATFNIIFTGDIEISGSLVIPQKTNYTDLKNNSIFSIVDS